MSSASAASVIAEAESQVGYREGFKDGNWDNIQKYSEQVPSLAWSDGQPWCAVFVSWVAIQAGAENMFPITASCVAGVSWWDGRGRFSEYPAVGAQVFYGDGGSAHTGIVVAWDATTITTIEGNTNDTGAPEGNGVYRQTRERLDPWVFGYGYPSYPGGIDSADPAWAYQNPARPPAFVPFPGASWFTTGRTDPIVGQMHRRLIAVGCDEYQTNTNVDTIGSGDVASYQEWQRRCGFTGAAATWPPGQTTWDRLQVPEPS